MSRSQYNTSLEYTELKCVATFIVKQGNLSGHAMLALEGKGIAPNGDDLLVFDFMQKAKAVQLAREEEKNRQSITDALAKLAEDLLTSERGRQIALDALSALTNRKGFYHATSAALIAVLRESKEIADFVKKALLTSSSTVTNSVLSLFTQDVGIIRSSHPLDSKNTMQKIREWESVVTTNDYFYSLEVSREELIKLIANVRSEEPKSRPFQYLGSQQLFWTGSNCLDWTLEKFRLMHSCTKVVGIAWANSGRIATPYSFCKALEAAVSSEEKPISALSS